MLIGGASGDESERRLFTLSRQQPAIYATVAIILAVAAGWLAAYVFRRP